MKNIVKLIVMWMLIICIISGCQTPEKKVEQDKKIETIKENSNLPDNVITIKVVDSVKEYQSMKEDWEKQIAKIEKDIGKLNKENIEKSIATDNLPVYIDKEYQFKLADLQKQSYLLRKKINNCQYYASYPKWNEAKEGLNHDMKNLNTSISDLKNKTAKND